MVQNTSTRLEGCVIRRPPGLGSFGVSDTHEPAPNINFGLNHAAGLTLAMVPNRSATTNKNPAHGILAPAARYVKVLIFVLFFGWVAIILFEDR